MIENEPPSDYRGVVQHEAGGHGFGKLIDEYIYYSTALPDEMIALFRQWEGFGHNANADLTDDPARIEWREFYELPGTAWSKRSREPTCTPEASGVPRRTVA